MLVRDLIECLRGYPDSTRVFMCRRLLDLEQSEHIGGAFTVEGHFVPDYDGVYLFPDTED